MGCASSAPARSALQFDVPLAHSDLKQNAAARISKDIGVAATSANAATGEARSSSVAESSSRTKKRVSFSVDLVINADTAPANGSEAAADPVIVPPPIGAQPLPPPIAVSSFAEPGGGAECGRGSSPDSSGSGGSDSGSGYSGRGGNGSCGGGGGSEGDRGAGGMSTGTGGSAANAGAAGSCDAGVRAAASSTASAAASSASGSTVAALPAAKATLLPQPANGAAAGRPLSTTEADPPAPHVGTDEYAAFVKPPPTALAKMFSWFPGIVGARSRSGAGPFDGGGATSHAADEAAVRQHL